MMNAKKGIIEKLNSLLFSIVGYLIIILFAVGLVLFGWGYVLGAAFITTGYFWTGIILIIITTFIWGITWMLR